jgi:hypothetical protein
MWRMPRNICGHDLMQKITSANRQKRSDSNPLPPEAEMWGPALAWSISRHPKAEREGCRNRSAGRPIKNVARTFEGSPRSG